MYIMIYYYLLYQSVFVVYSFDKKYIKSWIYLWMWKRIQNDYRVFLFMLSTLSIKYSFFCCIQYNKVVNTDIKNMLQCMLRDWSNMQFLECNHDVCRYMYKHAYICILYHVILFYISTLWSTYANITPLYYKSCKIYFMIRNSISFLIKNMVYMKM